MKRFWKQGLAALLCLCMILAVLTGCSKKETSTDEQNSSNTNETASASSEQGGSSEGEVVDESKDTIIVSAEKEATTLDPQEYAVIWTVQDQIFECLTAFDNDGNIVPELAESWEQTDDLTWKFNLRKDVKFHNGETMTSKDVLFTFERLLASNIAASNYTFIDPDGFSTPDDYTFILKTKDTYAFVLESLCDTFASIVSEKAVEDAGSSEEFGKNPVGTGAYKFVSWSIGDRVTLTRFDDYWGDKAQVKNVEIKLVTDASTRSIEVESGSSDIGFNLLVDDYDKLLNGNHSTIVESNTGGIRYFTMNTTKEPFDDLKVRLAMQYAVDKDVMAKVVYGEQVVTPTVSLMDATLSGYNPDAKAYPYDPEMAKSLLAEAGYPDGITIDFVVIAKASGNTTATLLKEEMAQAGITVNILSMDSAALSGRLNSGDYQFIMQSAKAQPVDAGYYLWRFYHTESKSNRSKLVDDELDAMLDKIMLTQDKTERDELAKQAQAYINENNVSYIPICSVMELVGLNKNLRGYEGSAYARPHFKDMYFVK